MVKIMKNEKINKTEKELEKTDEILDLGVDETEFELTEIEQEENKEREVDNNGDNN